MAAPYTGTPTASCYLDGRRWYGARKLSYHQKFKEQIETGSIEGRDPPVAPRIGMEIRWSWGYDGVDVAGFRGIVTDTDVASYPNTDSVQCAGVLWLADQNNEVLQTDPLGNIKASDAARYLLTHYGNIPASRLNLPVLPASGAAWAGGEWTLGILTPVQWGDVDTQSGGTTAMKAAAEMYGDLGYWLYANASGTVTAKAMERKPSTQAREVFAVDVNLLLKSPPHRTANYANVFNQATVRGANTGVDGAQLYDQRRTTSPVLKAGVFKDFAYSSALLEYENEADAGVASVSKVTERILNVVSRVPDVLPPFTVKADPRRGVGDTVGVINIALRLPAQKNYFIYELTRTLDLDAGLFDDSISLDGGTGSTGYTTIPPPNASFSWRLDAEALNGDAVVVVALDGSGSTSPTGEIVSWSWSTSTPTYASTPNTATGETATFVFLASDSPAQIALTVVDTTSKNDTYEASVDLTGADTLPPIRRTVSVAFGAAWAITPDGGATWLSETSNGDSVAVAPYGAGSDSRAPIDAGATYGLLSTRGSGGTGLRQTLDTLSTPSVNLASIGAAITCIWVNEANPTRVWVGSGDTVYRSTDAGVTFISVAKPNAGTDVSWIIEDPAVDDSVFVACGADVYNATDPTIGWALLYAGPIGATARQFVRSRDGQVTWIAYTGAPSGEALQRVENGAAADFAATDVRTLSLDKDATSLRATLTAITGDDPAQIWTFDATTGLSAAQLAPTLPSGATAMHMLPDPDIDLYYIADFNSVATGTGAVRKLIGEQLLLFRPGDSGQQAHMLGFGQAQTVTIELWILPSGATGAADAFFHYTPTTGWVSITPPQANWYWLGVCVAPDNPDSILAYGNTANNGQMAVSGGVMQSFGGGATPIYRSDDGGATWNAVTLSGIGGGETSATLEYVLWDDAGGGGWRAVANHVSAPFYPTWLWVGSGVSASVTTTTATQIEILIGASGLAGDLVVADYGSPYKVGFYTSSGTLTEPSGAGSGNPLGGLAASDRLGGPSPAVATLQSTNLYVTIDYRDRQPSLALASTGAVYLTATYEAVYLGGTTGVQRVSDPTGTPVLTTVGPIGIVTGPVRQARQNRASQIALAVRLDPTVSKDLYISRDGLTWSFLAGPPDAVIANLGLLFEVVSR